jgi:sugar/nucleoside kinase (ribokinase family)
MFISIGSIIIDDIVLPDGISQIGCLGGGSVHAVMGMRVWSENVGLVGKIGYDFPDDLMLKMKALFNIDGIEIKEKNKTIRAWQYFDSKGTRTEIFQTDLKDLEMLKADVDSFPDAIGNLQGVHLHCKAENVIAWTKVLRPHGDPFIFWEPWQLDCIPENRCKLTSILPAVDCISPNLDESRSLLDLPDSNIDDLLHAFLDHGAKMAIIRAGADGSAYADSEGRLIHVPVVKISDIVDQTGAGNAYCGGFVVAYVQSHDPQEALCKAAVSASFPLEQFGALFPLENISEKSSTRYRACMSEISALNRNL